MVLVLCVTAATGPCFTASPQRICVGLTRQIAGLIVVGDIKTLEPSAEANKSNAEEGEEGEVDLVKSNTFLNFLNYFRRVKRVATVNADCYLIADNKEENRDDDDDYDYDDGHGWPKGEPESDDWEDDGNGWDNDSGQVTKRKRRR